MHEGRVVVSVDAQGRVDRQIPWASEDALAKLASGAYAVQRRALSDGRQYYDLWDLPAAAARRRLSAQQQRVLALSARGLSGKAAAYATGLSQSRVSRELAEVANKVGCTNRTEVVWLATVLANAREPRAEETVRLSPSERHVLELAQRGFSNVTIARVRSTSARTVANQISSLLVKTGQRLRNGAPSVPAGV